MLGPSHDPCLRAKGKDMLLKRYSYHNLLPLSCRRVARPAVQRWWCRFVEEEHNPPRLRRNRFRSSSRNRYHHLWPTGRTAGRQLRGRRWWCEYFVKNLKESEGLLPFVVHLLDKHQYKFAGCGSEAALRTNHLLEAGRSAWDFQVQLNNMKGWPTHAHRQATLDSIVRFTTFCDTAGMKLIPKNHMMVFLGSQLSLK
jgi:hypothetical protein